MTALKIGRGERTYLRVSEAALEGSSLASARSRMRMPISFACAVTYCFDLMDSFLLPLPSSLPEDSQSTGVIRHRTCW